MKYVGVRRDTCELLLDAFTPAKSHKGNEKRAKNTKKRNRLRERICDTGNSQGPSVQNVEE